MPAMGNWWWQLPTVVISGLRRARLACAAGEWDSEETGTDETGDDTDTEEVSEKLPLKKAASQSENDSSSSSTFVTKS